MKYLVVIEDAYVPDLPGRITAAETRTEVTRLIHEAVEFHIDGMKEDGLPIPAPRSSSALVEVRA